MPTYAYACTECDHRFEVRQSFTDPAVSECPECAGGVRKLFNSVGIVFKGSGFYKTDSRAGNGNGSAKDSPAKDTASSKESSSGSGDKAGASASSGGSGSTGTGTGTKGSSSAA